MKRSYRRFSRAVAFRLAAVAFGLSLLVALETVLACLGLGGPNYREDPFVGFSRVYPLFVESEDGSRWEIPPSRQEFFCRESFPAKKKPGSFRIFCLGGSTVQGRPWAVETSFTTWLQMNLEAADPARRFEVINCGGISYASYRLVPILEEVLRHEPDLIILLTGHNEFLEDRTYGHVKRIPAVVARPAELFSRTRICTLFRQACVQLGGARDNISAGRPVLAEEADAMLEYRDGLKQYHRDAKWRRDVIDHFRFNLERMVALCDRADVPLLLLNPPRNIRDCPPFKSQHGEGLSSEQLKKFKQLCRDAGNIQRENMHEAMLLVGQAAEIDPQHAGVRYLLAKCQEAVGMTDEARQSYVQAKELDVCPLRILEPMSEAIRDTARRTQTPLIDLGELFELQSESGIPAGRLLVDHVHPSIAGHVLIAEVITEKLVGDIVDGGLVPSRFDWKEGRKQRVAEHLDSLSRVYFAKGQERLEILRCWTQGKADRVREEK